MFAAADTFKTLGGPGSKSGLGGGGRVSGIWRRLFIDVGISQQRFDGERVFMDDQGTVYRLGIPLTITMRPIDVAAGWRLPADRAGRVAPYVAGGMTVLSYREIAAFAQTGDDVHKSHLGALIAAGIDVGLARWVYVGGEVRYRHVPGILGSSGVSLRVRDDNAGGISAAVRVSIGR
jgi:hypothetical protein